VLTIVRVASLAEAIAVENGNPYGNACSVFTTSGAVAQRVAEQAHAGMIGVNVGVPVPREPFSFGGIQESKFGQGDITGPSAVEFWTQTKKITRKWAMQKDGNWMS
jgi:malonate-semialdehyde dehydrogenase (acetylating)/methylmalonate-semialdehyde dehydrogenase